MSRPELDYPAIRCKEDVYKDEEEDFLRGITGRHGLGEECESDVTA